MARPLLVLQHIGCEPPAAYEDELRAWEIELVRVQLDAGEPPDGAVQLAGSEAYEQQAFRVQRAYGRQFHLEVDASLASKWGEVPAYAQSLRELLGDEGLPTLLEHVRRHEAETIVLARRLFAARPEHVVGLSPP